jgi:hypothetical protein
MKTQGDVIDFVLENESTAGRRRTRLHRRSQRRNRRIKRTSKGRAQ